MELKETLAQLVSIDSVSSRSNAEIVHYLEDRCRVLGFTLRRYSYIDEAGVEKINLVAIVGMSYVGENEVELALVGHTDTVPYDPNWSEATTLTEHEGKLFGRGACDTKGFIAAALTAVKNIGTARLHRPLALVFTADEEVGLMGAKRLAEERPFKARYSIVGEPTSLRPVHAGKGYCLAEIVVKGCEAHSAYPALGKSAIFRAARLLTHLETIAERLTDEKHSGFDPPYTTLNVGLIQGGSAKNVIAGECRFTLEWRPIPGQEPGKVLEHLRRAIAAERINDPEFDCQIDASRADSGFETPGDSYLVTLLEQTTAKTATTVAFGTEAAQMIKLGAQTVVFGPGDIRVAHRTGEYVSVQELEECESALRQAIEQFCS